jgi:MoxR-like ATPase
LVLSYDALADDIPADHIVARIMHTVPMPSVAPRQGVAANQMGPGSMGPGPMGPGQPGSGPMGPGQSGPGPMGAHPPGGNPGGGPVPAGVPSSPAGQQAGVWPGRP